MPVAIRCLWFKDSFRGSIKGTVLSRTKRLTRTASRVTTRSGDGVSRETKMHAFDKKASMESWKKTMNGVMNGDNPYVSVLTMDTCGRTCTNQLCRNTSNLQRCGRCFRVYYCSKDCQRADWRNHKDLCQQVTAQAISNHEGLGNSSGKDMIELCKKCKTASASLKICGRCARASYCSKDCQREDWPQHKQHCKKVEKSQTESDWEAGKMFLDFARAMDPNQALPIRRSRKAALTWDEAYHETLSLHPDKRIITKLKDVTCEEDLDPVLMTSTVFLARLARPHPYVFRNAWYLEDCKGEEVRVLFYLDNNKAEPYFKWGQLDRGNFLCLEHAYIHTFLDGTTGIRVDDACDVSVVGD